MPQSIFTIGIVTAALQSDAREAVRIARQMDFAGVQFDAISPTLDLTSLSGTGRREFRHVIENEQRQLVGLRVQVGPKGFGPGEDIDRILLRLKKIIESAAELGAPQVCIDLGVLPEPSPSEKPAPAISPQLAGLIIVPETAPPREQERPPRTADPVLVSQVDAALAQLGAIADRFSVIVAMRSDLASFAALERALARAACPWFGVDLDPVAMLRDDWSAGEIFSRLGTQVRHVRGRDATAGANRRTMPSVIGSGSTNWQELLAHLDASGFHGWITIDPLELPDRLAGARSGLSALRKS